MIQSLLGNKCGRVLYKMGILKKEVKRQISSLPRLPVPPLRQTLEKYLLSVRPLLGIIEFSKTEKIAEDFMRSGGVGEKLHSTLLERAKTHTNWLTDWWLQCAYLGFRDPVVIYSSPGIAMPQQKFNSQNDQLKFASKLIHASLNFKTLIDSNQLPLETAGGAPLDMSQYTKIFGTCRVPDLPNDELLYNPDSKHIIVAHRNNYFKVDMYGKDGILLNEMQIFSQLKFVVEQSQQEKEPVGLLSTEHRDTWAKAYKRLCDNVINKTSVQAIQSSLFLLCLDKKVTSNSDRNYMTHSVLQAIHGSGGKANSGNRWYDKTIQFVIAEDGTVGLTYEHSPAEGPPIMSLVDYIMNSITKMKNESSSGQVTPCTHLPFNISNETSSDLIVADQDLNNLIRDLDMHCFTFNPFGKDFIKSKKLSPDSLIQIALQLAFYRMNNGSLAATYESASTRRFELGRTETIRSASLEALQFCNTMKDKAALAIEKAKALQSAVASHKTYTNLANQGLGVDRLLLGLKRLAIESGLEIPELYLDAGFTRSTHFRLSTSQVSAGCNAVMGYGPAVPNGYGCCYNPHPAFINFAVSAWNSSPDTGASKFGDAVQQSLTDIHDVLVAVQQSKL